MKKTYLQPETYVENVLAVSPLMGNASLVIDPGQSGGDALVKEDNSWDIWGSAEDDED